MAVQVAGCIGTDSRAQLKQPNEPLFTGHLAKQLERVGTSIQLLDHSAHIRVVQSRAMGSNQT